MMKKIFLLAMIASMVFAQDLTGVRICIDPGHSGHEGDDRFIEATGFWESESNLTKGLELRSILQGLGAEVAITRTGNNNTTDDLGLSERAAVANNFNADYFNSNHSNGWNGQANYAMVIYNGTTSSPTFPLARTMANIMAPLIHDVNHTTQDVSIGDLTLNPTWTYGYGVLVPANMPATISEGSFHDYIPESWRLMNLDYRKHEAMALARSYLAYFGEPGFTVGAIAGLIKDSDNIVSYYSMESLQDQWLPVNNIDVSIEPGGHHYYGGENNNGYFKVDSLDPGTYEVIVSAAGYATDTSSVTVTANQTTMSNFLLVNTAPPMVIESHPEDGDTTWAVWGNPVFEFTKAMDRTSLENAFSIEPSAAGFLFLSQDRKRMSWILADSLEFLTEYTITIAGTAMDVAGYPLDGNQDGTGGDAFTVSFRTSSRDYFAPVIEDTYPSSNAELVDLRPVFNISWDEEIRFDNDAESRVVLQRVSDSQIQETILEHYVINDKSLLVLYATNDLLDNEQYRVSVLPGFSDMLGNIQNSETSIDFTTSNYDFAVTNIDNFEGGVGNWWPPSGSGSTTGIDGDLTTVAASTETSALNIGSNTAMELNYTWLESAGAWLLREYLGGGAPRNVHFNSSKIMQAYIFGDGNGNQFRFCVDDNITGSGAHEVSPWYTIDWVGWRLVNWDMSEDGTGTWIGDGTLNGTLEFDSIQLTYVPGQPVTGVYYIDDLRVVTRDYLALGDEAVEHPLAFALLPNYPNPFNPWTSIPFTLPENADVSIQVYDLKGHEVAHLLSGPLAAGYHVTRWNASSMSSGLYLVKMTANDISITRKITVLK